MREQRPQRHEIAIFNACILEAVVIVMDCSSALRVTTSTACVFLF